MYEYTFDPKIQDDHKSVWKGLEDMGFGYDFFGHFMTKNRPLSLPNIPALFSSGPNPWWPPPPSWKIYFWNGAPRLMYEYNFDPKIQDDHKSVWKGLEDMGFGYATHTFIQLKICDKSNEGNYCTLNILVLAIKWHHNKTKPHKSHHLSFCVMLHIIMTFETHDQFESEHFESSSSDESPFLPCTSSSFPSS